MIIGGGYVSIWVTNVFPRGYLTRTGGGGREQKKKQEEEEGEEKEPGSRNGV